LAAILLDGSHGIIRVDITWGALQKETYGVSAGFFFYYVVHYAGKIRRVL